MTYILNGKQFIAVPTGTPICLRNLSRCACPEHRRLASLGRWRARLCSSTWPHLNLLYDIPTSPTYRNPNPRLNSHERSLAPLMSGSLECKLELVSIVKGRSIITKRAR